MKITKSTRIPPKYFGPSMLSGEESIFYTWLGEHYCKGEGSIVDAGCWLGSSSYYISQGLKRSAYPPPQIFCHDYFCWDKSNGAIAGRLKWDITPGDDFSFLTKKFLEGTYSNYVIEKKDYSIDSENNPYIDSTQKIEVLLIDAGKSIQLLKNILLGYLPQCIPGKSLIFFQDYFDYFCWFTPAIVEKLEIYLKPAKVLDNGGAAFYYEKQIGYTELKTLLDQVTQPEELDFYYNQSINKLKLYNRKRVYTLKANYVGLLLHKEKVTEAYAGTGAVGDKINDPGKISFLLNYFKKLDRSWPLFLSDSPLNNSWVRINHGISGEKKLNLKPKTFFHYLRPMPLLTVRIIKKIVQLYHNNTHARRIYM